MRITRDIKWAPHCSCCWRASLSLPPAGRAQLAQERLTGSMRWCILVEQTKEGAAGSVFTPYVSQLAMVRTHLINGESEAVYRAMNRFMEMLQAREEGISDEAADRLFDYCYLVTPARYHHVSRHLHRLSGHQAGAPSA